MSPGEAPAGSAPAAGLEGLDEFLGGPDDSPPSELAGMDQEPPRAERNVRGWLILGLLVAGILHSVGAGLWTRVNDVPISAQLGLFDLLPAPYWIGLALMGSATALAVRERSDALVVLTGAAWLAVIAGAPSLFEPNPSNWDAYAHFSEAQLILSTGHLPAANLGQYSANWPGLFLLFAMLYATAAVPAMTFIAIHPFVAGGLTFLAVFTFLRTVFPPSVAAPGSVLTSLFSVWAQYHLSPQSLGFILALLLLAFVWRRGIRWRIACGVLFLGLVVSHPTSTVLLLSILAAMCLFSPLWGRSSPESRQEARSLRYVAAAYAAVWFGWLYFRATATYAAASTVVVARLGQLIFLPEQTVNVAAARTTGNLLPVAPVLRLGSLLVFGVLGILALVLLLRSTEHRRLGWFVLSGLLAVAALAGADLVGLGGQFYDRSLLMFAVFAPGLCLTGIQRIRLPVPARRTVLVVLVVASVTAASTMYYLEAFTEVPDQSIALSDFVQRVPGGAAVLDGMYPPPVWRDPAGWTPFTGAKFLAIYPASPQAYAGSAPIYAVFDTSSRLWYEQWLGVNIYEKYEQNQTPYSRIYDNGAAAVYFVGG